MRRNLEISSSFGATISTGSFENSKPFYSVKEVYEDFVGDDNAIKARQQQLHDMCYSQFKAQAEMSNIERIEKQYQNLRFYTVNGNGKKYPGVTSIINMDKDFYIPQDELNQYAARGTLIHKQVEIFLKTGKWKAPKDIEECSFQYLSVIKGTLGLDFEDVNFRGFFEKYPFKVIETEKFVTNNEHQYCGRLDILGKIESSNKKDWSKIENIIFDEPIILDIKTSSTLDTMSGFTQQVAYAKAEGVKQVGLIHLTKNNKCGFAKPATTTNMERYWNLFLNKRREFRTRFGV